MFREQFGGHHDTAGEHGTEEEAQKRHGDGGDDELRHQPEDELQRNGKGQVDGNAETFAEAFCDETEASSTDCHAGPETGAADAGVVWRGVADAEHEGDDPPTEAD